MYFKHFYDEDLSQGSYLIGCQACGEAVVVDPRRDVTAYLEDAAANDLKIVAVTETHIHADYLSGALELAQVAGAKLYLSDEGGDDWQYRFDHLPLTDGAVIDIGNIRLTAKHTPGHTPEHLMFLVTDGALTDQPGYALTGDFVFVGDVGRPDLLDEAAGYVDSRFEGASRLFDSLRDVFLPLPDHVQVWPGHGAGSACGKALGAVASTTVGYEKLTAWWSGHLQRDDRAGFIEELLTDQPDAPTYFGRMKRWNRAGPALLGARPALPELDPRSLAGRVNREIVLLDTRPLREQREASVPGALSVPGGASFTAYASYIIDPEQESREIVLLARDQEHAHALRARLSGVGIDAVAGYVTSFDGLATRPLPLVRVDELASASQGPVDQNPRAAPGGEPTQRRQGDTLLDVRSAAEHAAGSLPGAKRIGVGQVLTRLNELPRGGRLVVYCQSGGRAAAVASALRARGFANVVELSGGYNAWRG